MSENIIFSLDKVYIQDASIEVSRNIDFLDPEQFPKLDAKMNINIDYSSKEVREHLYHTVIQIHCRASLQEESILILELEQAALFTIQNIPHEQMELVLNVECPNILFPYARETISNLSSKAGFPPIILSAINFVHIYEQKKAGAANNTKH